MQSDITIIHINNKERIKDLVNLELGQFYLEISKREKVLLDKINSTNDKEQLIKLGKELCEEYNKVEKKITELAQKFGNPKHDQESKENLIITKQNAENKKALDHFTVKSMYTNPEKINELKKIEPFQKEDLQNTHAIEEQKQEENEIKEILGQYISIDELTELVKNNIEILNSYFKGNILKNGNYKIVLNLFRQTVSLAGKMPPLSSQQTSKIDQALTEIECKIKLSFAVKLSEYMNKIYSEESISLIKDISIDIADAHDLLDPEDKNDKFLINLYNNYMKSLTDLENVFSEEKKEGFQEKLSIIIAKASSGLYENLSKNALLALTAEQRTMLLNCAEISKDLPNSIDISDITEQTKQILENGEAAGIQPQDQEEEKKGDGDNDYAGNGEESEFEKHENVTGGVYKEKETYCCDDAELDSTSHSDDSDDEFKTHHDKVVENVKKTSEEQTFSQINNYTEIQQLNLESALKEKNQALQDAKKAVIYYDEETVKVSDVNNSLIKTHKEQYETMQRTDISFCYQSFDYATNVLQNYLMTVNYKQASTNVETCFFNPAGMPKTFDFGYESPNPMNTESLNSMQHIENNATPLIVEV